MAELADDDITRILIAANYASLRAGLHALLAAESNVCVLGEAVGDAPALSRLLPGIAPDVILLDTSGEGASGTESLCGILQLLQSANSAKPGPNGAEATPIALVVLGDESHRDVPRLFAASHDLPGWAYLLRETADGPQIARAVRAASAGLVVLDKSIPSGALCGDTKKMQPADAPVPILGATRLPAPLPGETLTPRETEVLQLMAQGLPNKIIASKLKISLHTAKFHVAQILGKLGATSRTEAVTLGARRGYVIL